MKKSKKPWVSVNINGHKISALYDTGADICCTTAASFRQVFLVGKRPKKLNVISTVTSASGDKINVRVCTLSHLKLTRRNLSTTFM
jgi:predicted aspartyl protease